MFLLGLIAAVCFIPGYTGASVPTQWALFSATLPFVLWRSWRFSSLDWLMVVFLLWAAISLLWSKSSYDGGYELWIAVIWALAFLLGSTTDNLQPLWRGLAVGLTISSIVAIFQWLGYRPVLSADAQLAGLFFNSTALGAYSAVAIIGLASHRLWRYIPGLLPSLYLSHSRAAWAVILVTLTARYIHWTVAAALTMLGGIYLLSHAGPSDAIRLEIWHNAINNLSIFGVGVGSFAAYYFMSDGQLYHAEFVHNDPLQLWLTYGVGAFAIFNIFALALFRPGPERWPLLALALLSLVWFPLYAPITAVLAFVCTGHLLRYHGPAFDLRGLCRSYFLSWFAYPRSLLGIHRGQTLPTQPRA